MNQRQLTKSYRGLTMLLLIVIGSADIVSAQQLRSPEWIRQRYGMRVHPSRDNSDMIRLVRPLSESVKASVVQVLSGTRPVALGTVVSVDGHVLTKRSELTGDPVRVRLADGQLLPARVAAVRRRHDLALLKVDTASDMTPIAFVDAPVSVSNFLISPGRGGRPIGIGVVGVSEVSVEHYGRLGVKLRSNQEGRAQVREVVPGSGASQAGLQEGDLIVAINGREEKTTTKVVETLGGMYSGESVRLTIVRKGNRIEVDAGIRDMNVVLESENDSKVNGPRSERLSGFDRVIQHDTVLDPDECGGPILNSSGQAIGLNIARAGRVVSYALPVSLVIPEMVSMLQEAREVAP
tara:strand:- start:13049 stop:14098 length:1050 start_codon:yes stop_codon:yes gene_type:complete